MTTIGITPSDLTGTRLTSTLLVPTNDWIIRHEGGSWTIGVPAEGTDKLIKTYEERECSIWPIPVQKTEGIFQECLYRFWVKNNCILTLRGWDYAPENYVLSWLKENGIHIRYQDSLKLYSPSNNIRDCYITSSILEKLYGSG